MLEIAFVFTLFSLYVILWKIKQTNQQRLTGIDPQVMDKSLSHVQQYFSLITRLLTIYAAVVITIHALNFNFGSLFTRVRELSIPIMDIGGFVIGLIGLSLCLYAQLTMGNSWRVGIDEKVKTSLITSGLYAYIRNPTYLGLFLLNVGVWLIWPTWTIFLLNILFIGFLEVQVRCEEDFLLKTHGEQYSNYLKRPKRYLPFVY